MQRNRLGKAIEHVEKAIERRKLAEELVRTAWQTVPESGEVVGYKADRDADGNLLYLTPIIK